MKRLLYLFLLIYLPLNAAADIKAAHACFNNALKHYEKGNYEIAISGFETCKKLFLADLDENNIDAYINNCKQKVDMKLNTIQKAKEAAARAEAAKRAAYEAKRNKRQSDCLVRVVSDAYLFDNEYDLHSTVAGALSNAGFNMTDNHEASRWSVYVTAYAYEDDIVTKPYLDKNKRKVYENEYWSGVYVRVTIVDDINGEIIYKNEILERGEDHVAYHKNFEKAAKDCYAALKPQLGQEIVNNLKQNRQ